ncbi:MAG TPA: phosphoribosyltransferase family protein [Candidatus Nitrosocosmicus sp.]|nr:phosphoribosyltransferase family protein [Candidatus Nitrosocosmicus sp.]
MNLLQKQQLLLSKFYESARVIDQQKGYIDLPWINQVIDPLYLGYAADIIAEKFKDCHIDKVVGIPTMGTILAVSVAERLNKPLAPGRKGPEPKAWKQIIKTDKPINSFSTGEPSYLTFNGISASETILLIDDFIAQGETLEPIIKKLIKHKCTVCVAVYCAKLFQPGFLKITQLGIEPFFVYGIREITPEGQLILV